MRKLKLFLILVTTINSINQAQQVGNKCEDLPRQFYNYEVAFEKISKADFKINESANTSKSSWIRGASYLSCDGKTGFLIFKTDSKNYIHQGVPLGLWQDFQSATSFGKFWNTNLKGKYQLKIAQ